MTNIPVVKATIPRIIGPTNPPSAANELTSAIPTGAVGFAEEKCHVSKEASRKTI